MSGAILEEERNNLHSIVDSLQCEIERASLEKEDLRLRTAVIQDELANLKIHLQVMEDEKSSLSELNQNCEGVLKVDHICKSLNSLQVSDHVRHEHVADCQVPADESLENVEAELSTLRDVHQILRYF